MDEVFATNELVSLILHQADAQALVNCRRVCGSWKDIIDDSQGLQARLFFDPATPCQERQLNPFLASHFRPLLGPCEILPKNNVPSHLRAPPCVYADLLKLPWARDGIHADAAARQAFARKEASWRRMLISQPAITRLDWIYAFESSNHIALHEGYPSRPVLSGEGIAHQNFEALTLGLLWDFLESRLLRGCGVSVTYFLSGGSAYDDPSAGRHEKAWETRPKSTPSEITTPRLRVEFSQIWPGEGPEMWQKFHVAEMDWEIREELPFVPESEKQRRRLEAVDGIRIVRSMLSRRIGDGRGVMDLS